MITAYQQLDKRFETLKPLAKSAVRPSRGWVRAIREAMGMTTGQFAKRMRVHQPRVIELEKGEASGKITVQSLERAAQALGCRLVYVLVPEKPLGETMRRQAERAADRQLAAVAQTMLLEAQTVTDKEVRQEARERLVDQLLQKPARLWDEM
ncbi:MAG TPA: mobile mystery protein A [Rhizomicrobium sp.]|jgi:predicted DNA-binding mobile mystery protein A|nr:mobile mystery protein A [Rhizomicrobium sp.]